MNFAAYPITLPTGSRTAHNQLAPGLSSQPVTHIFMAKSDLYPFVNFLIMKRNPNRGVEAARLRNESSLVWPDRSLHHQNLHNDDDIGEDLGL
jgi:hypothetical protein